MIEPYDLIAIGSGTAAQVAIARARKRGWRVAVIDHQPFGGTCALRGCDPKKMLVSAEEAVDAARRMAGQGILGDLRIDWAQLMAFKHSFTDPIPDKQESRYSDLGVDAYHGIARFIGPNKIAVDGRELVTRFVLIATGANPVALNIPGEELVSTSDDFLDLASLPKRIVLIGGGYIAAEFSHLAARAGAHVSIVQRAKRLLPHFDRDVVGWLMPSFKALGIAVYTQAGVTGVSQNGDELLVSAKSTTGEELQLIADLVVHAAGRAPNLGDLDLEAGGIAVHQGRIRLSDGLQSISNPHVYAAGDASGRGPPLTPVASHDAKVAIANMLDDAEARPNYLGVPSVVFTIPPIASVGLSEDEARARNGKIRVNAASVSEWFTARRLHEPIYGYKVLIDKRTDLVLGANVVGPSADEVINLFGLAIRHGVTAQALGGTMFAYPTAASDIGYMLV